MLRITEISESANSVTLKVEGRIVSEWVTVLEQECLKWLRAKPEVLLDFSEVMFIEHNGVAMLKRIASPSLRLINCPALINELLNGNNNQNKQLNLPRD
ncbi:MAG: STAS domain-containing protein [Verrucomicrobia subdivision 3 bacterium]|nr:STAS domain-containing protein [Limisphaerales bacterium]